MLIETILMATLTRPLPPTWPSQVLPPVFMPQEEVTVRSAFGPSHSGFIRTSPAEREDTLGAVTVPDAELALPYHEELARKTAAQLIAYRDLPDDWDGEGATAPSAEAISDALDMLAVTPAWLDPPKPMVLPSGDVALYWDSGERYAEIGFDGSGSYYAFATAPGQPPVHLDDVPLLGSGAGCAFPDAVQNVLTWEALPAAA